MVLTTFVTHAPSAADRAVHMVSIPTTHFTSPPSGWQEGDSTLSTPQDLKAEMPLQEFRRARLRHVIAKLPGKLVPEGTNSPPGAPPATRAESAAVQCSGSSGIAKPRAAAYYIYWRLLHAWSLPMPITAKLSSRFYHQFGDEAANELVEWLNAMDATYQLQLRELNELNFARFSAEMRAGFAEQEAKFEHRFSELSTRLAWQLLGTLATLVGVLIALGEHVLQR